MSFQKNKPWRSETYLTWVKQQPSCISGLPSDDPHHIKGHGMGGTVKPPDWATMPLTRQEHAMFHAVPWTEWEMKHGNQWEHIARTLGRAIHEGIIGELK